MRGQRELLALAEAWASGVGEVDEVDSSGVFAASNYVLSQARSEGGSAFTVCADVSYVCSVHRGIVEDEIPAISSGEFVWIGAVGFGVCVGRVLLWADTVGEGEFCHDDSVGWRGDGGADGAWCVKSDLREPQSRRDIGKIGEVELEFLAYIVDVFLHLDVHLGEVIKDYGTLTYLILFAIIFCETGLVVTPFLPGDSLLFAAGAFAALGSLDLTVLLGVLYLAPILGDSTNYWIGRFIGPRVYNANSRWVKREYIDKTHAFYDKHGGKTIVIARFMPIFRTFAPFVAGIGKMNYMRFFTFSVFGTLLWITICVVAGYYFGNIPFVKKNFSLVIFAIIGISILPMVIHLAQDWLKKRRAAVPNA